MQIRRFERGFFHPKAVVTHGGARRASAVVGSFNLTRGGLLSNIELGVGVSAASGEQVAERVAHYWQQAEPYDLQSLTRLMCVARESAARPARAWMVPPCTARTMWAMHIM